MKRALLSTLLACLLLACTRAQVNQQDSLALINIYNTTNGGAWTQKWIRTQPVSSWFGVTITSGRVTQLNLPDNNLAGTLNSANMSKLTKLKTLNVEHNSLSGGIPAGIKTLVELEQLNLSFNAFTGNVPSGFFNNLVQLKVVRLNNNNIGGWFPSLSNSVQLEEINFSNNAITNKIPATINNLTHLAHFLVNNNQLFGALPVGVLCSPGLQIDVSGNAFTFTGLECLGANSNAVYGNQKNLTLAQNNLKLTAGAGGTASNNTYTWYRDGSVYHSGAAASLNAVETGTYKVVATNSQLPNLALTSNEVTISNVGALLQQDSLALVDLYNSTKGSQWLDKTNWLTNAPLQNWFGVEIENGRVANIYLNENNLDGKIGSSIRNLTALKNLELVKNKLNGFLPDLSKALQLNSVRLSNNQFRGGLPTNWGNLVQLTAIELSSNQLTGSIPANFGNFKKLVYLFLSNNLLSGAIPESIAELTLWEGWFDHNQFTGPVPQGFCSGTSVINLAYNKFNFTGTECFVNQSRVLYQPQATVPLIKNDQVLKAAAGGTLSNNTYKWYKDDVLVDTKTGDSTFNLLAPGTYHAIITNNQATQLTLSSDTAFFLTGFLQDSLALVDLYNNTNGPGWTNKTNWLTTAPLSEWYGVGMNEGRVETLWLNDNNLDGELPVSFSNLGLAYELVLRGNKLKGAIPASFAFPSVFHIDLSHNEFTSIPLSYNIVSTYLDLSHNLLSGTIPGSIYNVATVKLNNNKFNFTDFYYYDESMENITIQPQQPFPLIDDNPVLKVETGSVFGTDRYHWYKDNVLVATKVGNGSFDLPGPGNYHATITNNTVAGLTLHTDTLNISIVQSMITDSLALVDFYNNITSGLSWNLTSPVSTWQGIYLLNDRVSVLNVRGLTGTISPSIGNLGRLKWLIFGPGNLTDTLPATLGNLSYLESLDISNNQITGSIPNTIGPKQQRLISIILPDNQLTGPIPEELQYAINLEGLYLANNKLTGELPDIFKNLSLRAIDLYNNKLTGKIPDRLSNYWNMYVIQLSHNKFTGSFPNALPRVGLLDVSHNQLSGTLPPEITGTSVYLNNNQFSGRIPKLSEGGYELNVSNNLLENMSTAYCSNALTVALVNFSNNRLNFSDLECLGGNPNLTDKVLDPQQKISVTGTRSLLRANAGGTLANNTYRWYKDGQLLTTKTGDLTLTITSPGIYHCVVTNSVVPGVELVTQDANISSISSRKGTSDADLLRAGTLTVYPNPVNTDVVYIKGLQKAVSVLLYNAAGQLMKQWQQVNGTQPFNISSLGKGVYMIKVIEKDKQTMLRFVK